jgi:hypothetical protein
MSEGFSALSVLSGFGLGLSAGLLLPLLARSWSQRLLLAANERARRYSLFAVAVVGILSALILAGGQREPAVARVAATPPATAGSMEIAIAELSARLATGAGTDAD